MTCPPGIINSDDHSKVKVLFINCGQKDFSIKRGMRIAQTVISPVIQVNVCAIVCPLHITHKQHFSTTPLLLALYKTSLSPDMLPSALITKTLALTRAHTPLIMDTISTSQ
ncbi:hypothetical protein [Bartonella sp. AP58NXGY]|uniref:hypothetical protein n=1 Tax=Bartonella sp. AP58NXGY TaxID=3243498 RepID=UPI0035D136DD